MLVSYLSSVSHRSMDRLTVARTNGCWYVFVTGARDVRDGLHCVQDVSITPIVISNVSQSVHLDPCMLQATKGHFIPFLFTLY